MVKSEKYRVTNQVEPNPPLTSKQKFSFGLAWPGQRGTLVFMSTGGLSQPDVSPCMLNETPFFSALERNFNSGQPQVGCGTP